MEKIPLIGLLGGTFDPPHFGHINLALEMMEHRKLDEVWFCPARISPHKLDQEPIPVAHRLEMTKLAIEGIPNFRMIDIEAKRSGPSYTFDTIQELINQSKLQSSPKNFALILGEDVITNFFQWYKPEEIIRLATVFIGYRPDSTIDLTGLQENPVIVDALSKGLTATRVMEISSTELRQRLHDKLYCGHLIPSKVLDYIMSNHLY